MSGAPSLKAYDLRTDTGTMSKGFPQAIGCGCSQLSLPARAGRLWSSLNGLRGVFFTCSSHVCGFYVQLGPSFPGSGDKSLGRSLSTSLDSKNKLVLIDMSVLPRRKDGCPSVTQWASRTLLVSKSQYFQSLI